MAKKKYSFLARILIGCILLVIVGFIISRTLTLAEIQNAFAKFSVMVLIGSLFFSLAIILSKNLRFYFLIKKSDINIGFWQSCKIFFASQAASLLPGSEFVRGALLKTESGEEAIKSSGPVLAQALTEISSGMIIVLMGSFFYPSLRLVSAVMFFLLLVIILYIFFPIITQKTLNFLKYLNKGGKYIENLINSENEVRNIMLGPLKKPDVYVLKILAFGIASQIIGGLFIFFIAAQLHEYLNFLQAIFIYSVAVTIQGIIGIIPGGLGVTEGGMLGLLSSWGLPNSTSILLVIIFRIWTLLFPVLIGVIFLIIFYWKRMLGKG